MLRRLLTTIGALGATLALLSGPAAAHNLEVDPPGGGQGPEGVTAGGDGCPHGQ